MAFSNADPSLFVYHRHGHVILHLLHVDDIIIITNSSKYIDQLVQDLVQAFSIKDLDSLHFFLGIEVPSTQDGMFLSQQKYATDLLCPSLYAPVQDHSYSSSFEASSY